MNTGLSTSFRKSPGVAQADGPQSDALRFGPPFFNFGGTRQVASHHELLDISAEFPCYVSPKAYFVLG